MTRKRRSEREVAAEQEAAWFYGELGGRVPEPTTASPEVCEAARDVQRRLATLPPFHRGALSLWYTDGDWPEPITRWFGRSASLVVRLECALHPAVGRSTDELERESAGRLLSLIAAAVKKSGSARSTLHGFERRARGHVNRAVAALASTRGGSRRRVAPAEESIPPSGERAIGASVDARSKEGA
jgi:hypothetical protein